MAKNVLLGICGSIASFKIPLLIRLLKKHGHNVKIVASDAAKNLISINSLAALSGEPVHWELFGENGAMEHIDLARWADIFVIAPLTANSMAKLAQGLADNLLSNLYLATTAPVLLAPAMNPQMWLHPAVQQNVEILRQRHRLLEPDEGNHACGEEGKGRMVEPEALLAAIEEMLPLEEKGQQLRGQKILITAGATKEHIDPVRFISNHSSGKMALALAREALARGAEVCMVAGQISVAVPEEIRRRSAQSALEMLAICEEEAPHCDIFIGCAAVADYRVKNPLRQKHKKSQHGQLTLELVENPDIIKTIAQSKQRPRLCVGFSAETENLQANARRKLQEKSLDLIIANDVSEAVFGEDFSAISIINAAGQEDFPRQSKQALAVHIWDFIGKNYGISGH